MGATSQASQTDEFRDSPVYWFVRLEKAREGHGELVRNSEHPNALADQLIECAPEELRRTYFRARQSVEWLESRKKSAQKTLAAIQDNGERGRWQFELEQTQQQLEAARRETEELRQRMLTNKRPATAGSTPCGRLLTFESAARFRITSGA